jgi:hypothetical protein
MATALDTFITLDIKIAYFQVQYTDTFLGRDTVYSCKSAPTFRRFLQPPSS